MEYDQTIKKTRPWEVLFSAGTKALEDGDFNEAESFLIKAYDHVIKYGNEDPRIALISNSLSEVYCRLEKFDKAEQHYKLAIDVIENALGTDYSSLANIREQYSKLLRKMGRDQEAKEMSKLAEEIKRKKKNPKW